MNWGAGASGGGPVDILASEISGVIECAGVTEIAGLAQLGVKLHSLAVAQRERRFTLAEGQVDAGAGTGLELQKSYRA